MDSLYQLLINPNPRDDSYGILLVISAALAGYGFVGFAAGLFARQWLRGSGLRPHPAAAPLMGLAYSAWPATCVAADLGLKDGPWAVAATALLFALPLLAPFLLKHRPAPSPHPC